MEAALSDHEQSSFSTPFPSSYYLTERMGLAVMLLHEWQISLAEQKNTHRKWYPWWDLLMGRSVRSCWMLLSWTGWSSLPCWEKKREGSVENTCACSHREGEVTPQVSKTSCNQNYYTRTAPTRRNTAKVNQPHNFLALGKHRKRV